MKKGTKVVDRKVSIIIPAFNEEEHIGKLLDTLQTQTIKPNEIIVVDNNSTDKTVEIAKKYPVKIIHEKTQGISYARDAGFNAAKYELMIRFDADIILPHNYIEQVKKIFKSDEDIIAVSGNIKFIGLPHGMPTFLIEFPFTRSAKFMLSHDTLIGPHFSVTKKAWDEVKDTLCEADGEGMHEDMDLSIHLAKLGKIKFDPKLVVQVSSRRIRNDPYSFFIEYSIMALRTLIKHKAQFFTESKSA